MIRKINKRLSQVRSLPSIKRETLKSKRLLSTPSMLSQRKGSHVGIVISFIMFVTFVFFFYIIIQPTITSESKKNLFDYLRGQTAYILSENVTEVSVIVNQQNSSSCVELQDFFIKTGIGDKFIVRTDSGSVTSQKNINNLRIDRDGNLFFRIYGSEEFDVGGGAISGCQILTENSGYTLGLIKTDKNVFETKIIDFIENYSTDYENMKKQLRIPAENEFGFDFVYADGTNISAQNFQIQPPTSSTNIYVDEIQVQYISRDAAREAGLLRIKIW